jgi:hypothetical protein
MSGRDIRRHVEPPRQREPRPDQDFLGPDRGQCLEVGLSSDEREIIVNIPDTGEQWITFSPAQARHLAKLLLRKADECKP